MLGQAGMAYIDMALAQHTLARGEGEEYSLPPRDLVFSNIHAFLALFSVVPHAQLPGMLWHYWS